MTDYEGGTPERFNHSQAKMGCTKVRHSEISPTAFHDIIKRMRESWEISAQKEARTKMTFE